MPNIHINLTEFLKSMREDFENIKNHNAVAEEKNKEIYQENIKLKAENKPLKELIPIKEFGQIARSSYFLQIQKLLRETVYSALEKELEGKSKKEIDEAFDAIYNSSAFCDIYSIFALDEHFKNALNPKYEITQLDAYISFDLKEGRIQAILVDNGKGYNLQNPVWESLATNKIVNYDEVLKAKEHHRVSSENVDQQKETLSGAMKGLRILHEIAKTGTGKLEATNFNFLPQTKVLNKILQQKIMQNHSSSPTGAVLVASSPTFRGTLKSNLTNQIKEHTAQTGILHEQKGKLEGGRLHLLKHIHASMKTKVQEEKIKDKNSLETDTAVTKIDDKEVSSKEVSSKEVSSQASQSTKFPLKLIVQSSEVDQEITSIPQDSPRAQDESLSGNQSGLFAQPTKVPEDKNEKKPSLPKLKE